MSDGAAPYGGLIQGPDGNLYGTTSGSGANGAGTVFKIAPDGSGFTTVWNFNGIDASGSMTNLILAKDGNFYGTSENGGNNYWGNVFMMPPTAAL